MSTKKAPIRATTPPSNKDAERYLIASVLLFPEVLDQIADLVRPEEFYLADFGNVYKAALHLWNAGSQVEIVTVASEIKSMGLPEVDVSMLEDVIATIPYAAHAEYHAKLIRKAFLRRSAIYVAGDLILAMHNDGSDLSEAIGTAESGLHRLLDKEAGVHAASMADIVVELMQALQSDRPPGVPTGFGDLDNLLHGLQPGSLSILAARSSAGKTAFAGCIALQVAKRGTPVLFFSLEQSRQELAERFICAGARITSSVLKSRKLSEAQWDSVTQAGTELAALPLTIDDLPSRSVSQIAAVARLQRRKHGVGLVIVDYLQIVAAEDRRVPREQQVAEITRALKNMARALGLPVIVLAQLNRQIEGREDKRPRLSDLRESGAIEQDADQVIFIDRPGCYDQKAESTAASLIVAKHRNGQTGDVPLHWDGATMTFRSATHRAANS